MQDTMNAIAPIASLLRGWFQTVPLWLWVMLGVLLLLAGGVWAFLRWVLPSETYRIQWQWRVELWHEIWFDDWVRSEHIKRQLHKRSKFFKGYAYSASVLVALWALLIRHRWVCVLLAGCVSALLLGWIVSWLTDDTLRETLQRALFPNSTGQGNVSTGASTGAWSLLSAVLIAPIAFVLWWFRDTNQLWLIENNRKDTNLKDFQKLCEWATGMHLVEDEVSTKTVGDVEETTVKHSRPVRQDPAAPPSRREGSEALQVASVHQLKGYLVGDFGKQFERPALVLLLSLWESLTQNLRQQPPYLPNKEGGDLRMVYTRWREDVRKELAVSPLTRALELTLLADKGLALRKHANMLPRARLFGIHIYLAGGEGLRLNAQDLRGIDLDLAYLNGVQLQGAELQDAQLQGAFLGWAKMQGATLHLACLQGVDLSGAILHGAVLSGTRMQGAYLGWTELQKAVLNRAQLQGAEMLETQLEGAVLYGAQLQAVKLTNPKVDGKTKFTKAITDDQTTVIVQGSMGSILLPVPTHALRLKLRDVNGLKLVASAYEEFRPEYDAITEEERKLIYDKAYEYSANPGSFWKDFPHLANAVR